MRVGIFDTEILVTAGGVANPVNIIPSSSLITVQNLVTVSFSYHHTVCLHVGSSKNFGDDGSRPPYDGA